MSITTETLFLEDETANSKQIAILKQNFPQCFDKKGNFLPEKMAELVQASNVDIVKESYSLNWLGKSYARLLTNLPPQGLIKSDADHNNLEKNKNSQNILIKGDNLEVLKHLTNAYRESVKMIYIDPPYNTGSDGFVYEDNFKFTSKQLMELASVDKEEADRIISFTEKGSNSHSAWLTFMYPRLYIARELLKEDGVIFISIDDNEQATLKLLCDDIFSEENFIASLPVVMNLKGNQDNFGFADTHEYCLVYGKNKNESVLDFFDVDEEELENSWTEDEHGLYKVADNLRATGANAPREKRQNLWYPIFLNETDQSFYNTENDMPLDDSHTSIYPLNPEGDELSWYWKKTTFNRNKHNLILKKTKNGWQFYRKQRPQLGDIPTKKPKTIWYKPDYSTSSATTDLKNLLGAKVFPSPKPIPFLYDLIKVGIASESESEIILDFFTGSGSTAQAVFEFNLDQNKSHDFLCVQLDLPTYTIDKDSGKRIPKKGSKEAFDAGYSTIFDITQDRVEKAGLKIQAAHPSYKGDLGFKIFEATNDFRVKADTTLDLDNPSFFNDIQLTDAQYQALLTTWRLYDGSKLTETVYDISLNGYTAHLCKGRLYLIAPDFTVKNITALLEKLNSDKDFAPNKIVMYGSNFDSAHQMELNEALKSYGNKKSIDISLIARY